MLILARKPIENTTISGHCMVWHIQKAIMHDIEFA